MTFAAVLASTPAALEIPAQPRSFSVLLFLHRRLGFLHGFLGHDDHHEKPPKILLDSGDLSVRLFESLGGSCGLGFLPTFPLENSEKGLVRNWMCGGFPGSELGVPVSYQPFHWKIRKKGW